MSRKVTSSGGAGDRDARLKQALKANLQRRKAQARARAAGDGEATQNNETGGGPAGEAERDG